MNQRQNVEYSVFQKIFLFLGAYSSSFADTSITAGEKIDLTVEMAWV